MDSGIYHKWIEDIDALSEAQREEVQKILRGLRRWLVPYVRPAEAPFPITPST